jgi:hypothetical protein
MQPRTAEASKMYRVPRGTARLTHEEFRGTRFHLSAPLRKKYNRN